MSHRRSGGGRASRSGRRSRSSKRTWRLTISPNSCASSKSGPRPRSSARRRISAWSLQATPEAQRGRPTPPAPGTPPPARSAIVPGRQKARRRRRPLSCPPPRRAGAEAHARARSGGRATRARARGCAFMPAPAAWQPTHGSRRHRAPAHSDQARLRDDARGPRQPCERPPATAGGPVPRPPPRRGVRAADRRGPRAGGGHGRGPGSPLASAPLILVDGLRDVGRPGAGARRV